MCGRIIFSESILIPRKNVIFIQKIKKAIIDDSFQEFRENCQHWYGSVIGEQRVITGFKQCNNSCNFHFLGYNSRIKRQVNNIHERCADSVKGLFNNIHWNTIISWSITRSKAITNLRDFLFWCQMKKKWINEASIQKRTVRLIRSRNWFN